MSQRVASNVLGALQTRLGMTASWPPGIATPIDRAHAACAPGRCVRYSQNLVTGTGSFAPLPSQNMSFWSIPLLAR